MKPNGMAVVTVSKRCLRAVRYTGFWTVADYRLYGLDGVGKVASAEWIQADDDQAAIAAVEQTMDGHDCELWQGPRLIARLKHKDGE